MYKVTVKLRERFVRFVVIPFPRLQHWSGNPPRAHSHSSHHQIKDYDGGILLLLGNNNLIIAAVNNRTGKIPMPLLCVLASRAIASSDYLVAAFSLMR
ncbi:hypothetical protein ACE1CM_44755 [Microseira sp. BLCC-F43]